jgi:hypothetical protein
LETPRLFLELAARTSEQSGEKGLGQGEEGEHDGHSDRAAEFLCDGKTFQKDNQLCSTPPIRPLW